ncbi:hypothetical protein FHL15_009990 [Xylaria flabelliformis]|uniref:Uncharacterized protein n=1 Tax=Xylaria flabelliformis TaxID=2512241 RepID=A0A553HM90_9PEZI|nr:hypothetical protein FHL15_009990 [Xylaria flabelliformis]
MAHTTFLTLGNPSDVRFRVRRKDLDDSASASTSSGEEEVGHDAEAELALRAKLNAQLSGLLDFSFKVDPKAQQHQTGQLKDQLQGQAPDVTSEVQQEDENPEEEAFTFRLFRDEALTHTVVLTNDEDPAALGDGGFVVPLRPRSYYIASSPSPGKVSEYRSVAVSAEYVLADAKRRRWGLEKPWRVIRITPNSNSVSPKTIPGSAQEEDSAEKKRAKRTRPGKKHRIILRVREKAARDREEAAKKSTLEKEQHLQEKRKRLNRERKLKRRQKEREKKAGAQGTNPDGGRADDSLRKDAEDEASVAGDE